jgi:hypothetical protein
VEKIKFSSERRPATPSVNRGLLALLPLAPIFLYLSPEYLGLNPQDRGARDSFNAASLLAGAATPEDLAAIRLTCLEKEIDLELILEQWQVSRLKELDEDSAQWTIFVGRTCVSPKRAHTQAPP